MFVVTIDQRASRRAGDRVPQLLQSLAALPGVLPFERTVGDEVQGVLDDADLVVRVTLDVLRSGQWYVGVGAGAVDRPLPSSARAASGPAFIRARSAIEQAKTRGRPVPVAVHGADVQEATDAEAVLILLGAIVQRRTEAGWAVIDAFVEAGVGARQEDVAARLGISQQAVSQRLRTAMWAEETAARPAVARLLERAQGEETG